MNLGRILCLRVSEFADGRVGGEQADAIAVVFLVAGVVGEIRRNEVGRLARLAVEDLDDGSTFV